MGGQVGDRLAQPVAVLSASRRLARSLLVNLALVRAFRRSPQDFLNLLLASGAGEHPIRVGPERVLLIEDATEAWELLTVHAHRTGKGRGLVRARLLLGEGLLTSEADEHLRQRRALQPAFRATELGGYEADFARAARHLADRWLDGGEVDLVAELSALTLDGAGSTLFGSDLRGPATQISRALSDLRAGFQLAMAPAGPLLLRSPLPVAVRVQAARAALGNVVDDLIRGRWSSRGRRGPVLDLLASQPNLSAGQVRDQVTTLLLAGHETTAMTLVWALAAIDQAPEVRGPLETEWDATAGTPVGQPAEVLPVTLAVLAETLRLWPPSWMISRRVLEPVILGDRTIPVGTMCLVSPALLHRAPRWWSEPDRFLPERWLRRTPGGADRFDPKAPGQPRGAYLPFGAGPRICIGEQFAWSEAATMLAELGRSWRIRVHHAPLTAGRSSMTLRPRGPVRATTCRRVR
ncbi:MAG: cytochrome P450 [Friedmanniella sp.]